MCTVVRQATRVVIVAGAITCVGAGIASSALAQSRDGLSAFFETLFGGSRPVATAARPDIDERLRDDAVPRRRFRRQADRVVFRPTDPRREAKSRLRVVVHAKTPPARPTEPRAALMADETLREGDIVVMPDGPKVFVGLSGSAHRPDEFQDARGSRRLDQRTREVMAALIVSPGGRPAPRPYGVMAQKGGADGRLETTKEVLASASIRGDRPR